MLLTCKLKIRDFISAIVHSRSVEHLIIHCVSQKWRRNRNHNLTMTNLLEFNILLAVLIIASLVQTLQISTKSTAQFLSNSCLKNGTQKQKFLIWKNRLSSLYTYHQLQFVLKMVAHLHRHLYVSCADRTFSAAAGLPVCRPCSVNLPQKSVQCWTKPVLVRKFVQQLIWHCNPYSALKLWSVFRPRIKTIAFYVNQMSHKNLTNIISLFVTLSTVSMLIGIFHIGKVCF